MIAGCRGCGDSVMTRKGGAVVSPEGLGESRKREAQGWTMRWYEVKDKR
jgi:hypothetical protein